MQNELVSIIIPSYNSGKTITLCLDAVFNQNYRNREVLVIDDGSTDDSPVIAAGYPCRIYKTPGPRSGPSAARNLGAQYAEGSILFFIDSDIALYPDAIANAVREFAADASIGSVCGIYAKTPLIKDSLIEEYRTLQGYYWRKSSEGFVTPMFFSLGAIKKEVFMEIGRLNTDLKDAEDVEYGCRLNRKYKLLLTSSVLGRHDDEDKLLPALKKFFERSRYRVPIYIKWGRFMKGFETPARVMGVLLAACALFILPFAFVAPVTVLLSPVLFLLFLLTDIGQYRFVFREKKLFFLLYFMLIHFIINVNVFLGIVKGTGDWIFSRKFREKFRSL